MQDILGPIFSAAGGLAVVYTVLLVAMWRYSRKHGGVGFKDALRILPDVLVLVKRLAMDKSLGWKVRLRLMLLLVFLASPLDIIPDFIPVIGIADDLVVVALVLRSVVKSAGREALERNWPGTEHGLALVGKLV